MHLAFPDDDLARVARTFAWSRLAALVEAAGAGTFAEDEIQALWERVQPADLAANVN